MKWIAGLLVVAAAVTASPSPAHKPKAFSLFSVVTFPNDECTTTMSSSMHGVCVTQEECSENNGESSGNCASGFGVCCFYKVDECGKTVQQNITYIQNENYPKAITTLTGNCEYKVQGKSDICSIRLDFDQGVLADPTAETGVCTDSFIVASPATPASKNGFKNLCGTLTGQHMYIDTARSESDAATITISFGAGTSDRSWKIKVTQIECDNPSRPPTGCLQYFMGIGGRVKSFNAMNQMIKEQDYEVCIRQEMGFCGLQISEYTVTPDSFLLGEDETKAKIGTDCTKAFIGLTPNEDTSGTMQRFCGGALADTTDNTSGAAITVKALPFRIKVYASSTDQATSKGFDLQYRQTSC